MVTSTASRAPGVVVDFIDPPPPVEPTRVDVPLVVCVAERGPVDTPVRCGSWSAFTRTFGSFIPNGLGAYALKAFFDQAGAPDARPTAGAGWLTTPPAAWVVRVAAPERTTSTSGTQPPDRLSSIVAATDGLVVGAVAALRQGSSVHQHLVSAVDPAAGQVWWTPPVHAEVDLSVPIDIATGAASALVELPDAGGSPTLRVLAASPGVWGNRLSVVAQPGRRIATRTRPDRPGGAAATPVLATAGFVPGDLVRVSQDAGGTPIVDTAIVESVDQARRVLWWNGGLPASIDPAGRFSIETLSFSLSVLSAASTVEIWPDLSLRPEHPRYAPSLTATSPWISLVALGTLPAASGQATLAGGRDGTAALSVDDIIGDELAGVEVGLAAASEVDEPAVVLLPDLVAAPTPARVTQPLPPADPCDPCNRAVAPPTSIEAMFTEAGASFGVDEIALAQQAAIDSCERSTERIVLLDPPSQVHTLTDLRGWAARFSSSYAVTIAPWLRVIEPTTSTATRAVPASGHLAGLIGRCDVAFGPWQSPANRTLVWAHGLVDSFNEQARAIANDDCINLITAPPGRGLVPMGARTLAADDTWRFVAVRRTMIMIRRTLRHHLAWVPFAPNNAGLASLLTGSIGTLLNDLWDAGALAGDSPDQAYGLAIDQSQAAAGQLLILVGVALARPAEFITVLVSRTDNRLQLTEEPEPVEAGAS